MMKLEYSAELGDCDLVWDPERGTFSTADPLRTAMLISVFTDRRVLSGEVPVDVDLGGWWGASYERDPTDPEGSRLWILPVKGRADALTARECEGHVREALAWMIERGFVTSLVVAAAVIATGVIGFTVRAVVAEDRREILLTLEVI